MSGYYAQQIHHDALPGVGGGGRGVRQSWGQTLTQYLEAAQYRSYHSGSGISMESSRWWLRAFARYEESRKSFTAAGNAIDDQPIQIKGDEQVTMPRSRSPTMRSNV